MKLQIDFFHQDINQLLYCGNNMDFLPCMESASVELVCIDPPYNTGKHRVFRSGSYRDTFGGSESYIKWITPILEECYRILTGEGSLFMFCDSHEEYNLWTLLRDIFGADHLKNKIVWAYDWGHRETTRWTPKHDIIFWFVKDKRNYTFNRDESDRISKRAPNLFQDGSVDKLPTDVWWQTVITKASKESTGYPTQKPLKIIERIIRVHSNPHDTVMDCFAGSGTVGVACKTLMRNSILIEQNPEAIEIIKKRIGFDSIKIGAGFPARRF